MGGERTTDEFVAPKRGHDAGPGHPGPFPADAPRAKMGTRRWCVVIGFRPYIAAIISDCFTITSACLIEAISTSRPL